MASALGAAALEYADRGWSVIPIRQGSKKPLVAWAPYQEKAASPTELRAWWKKWPDANIGLVTGRVSSLVVLDIDIERGGDVACVQREHPTGLVSQTGSGGYHLFYAYPAGVDRVANQVREDGIDVRGDGGYVVLPPSIHESGRAYAWMHEDDAGEAPSWVSDQEASPQSSGSDEWLSDALRGAARGSRNDTCARLAGYFAKKQVPEDVAVGLLEAWNQKNEPPLPAKEVAITVGSVYKAASRRATSSSGSQERGETADPFNLVPLQAYMTRFADEQIEWLIPDWMPDQTVTFVVAPPGAYKTWLLTDLVVSVAGGVPFLGLYPVEHQGPVLFVQQEDFHGQIAERLAIVTMGRYGLVPATTSENGDYELHAPPDLPLYLHTDRRLRFDDAEVMGVLEKKIAEIRPRLVAIDPLYSAASTDDYMAKTAEHMFQLKRLRDRYGCSFVVAHHTKKGAGDGARENLWGSQFLNAFLETGWQVRLGSGQGEVVLKRHFKVKGDLPDVGVHFDINTDPPYRYSVEVGAAKTDSADAIVDLLAGKPMKAADITTELGVNRSTVTRKLAQLEKNGIVVRRGNLYSLADTEEF